MQRKKGYVTIEIIEWINWSNMGIREEEEMKKQLLIIIGLILLLVGCGNSSKPEDTVKKFLEASKQFDIEKMSEYAKNVDWNDKEQEEYLKQQAMIEVFKIFSEQIVYEIGEAKTEESASNITIKLSYPDGSELYKTALGNYITNAMTKALSGEAPSTEEMEQMLYNSIKEQMDIFDNKEFKIQEKEIQIRCVKEDEKWIIEDTDDAVLNAMTGNFLDTLTNLESSLGE